MKTLYTFFSVAVLSLTLAVTAFADEPLRMGTGGERGNYYGMGQDVAKYCAPKTAPLVVKTTGGSIANLDGMFKKDLEIGMVQEDVLTYRQQSNPTRYNPNTIKTIAGMHMEAVHVFIPKGYKPKAKGGSLWGNLSNMFDDVLAKAGMGEAVTLDMNLLKGQEVASWGGSVVSAKALGHFLKLDLVVKAYDKDEQAFASGLPIIAVGGLPYKPAEAILGSGKYILVGLNASAIQGQAGFYQPIGASYVVNGGSYSVQTVAVRALLVGKVFRSEATNSLMKEIQTCIADKLADLADARDTNPAWASVYELKAAGREPIWAKF